MDTDFANISNECSSFVKSLLLVDPKARLTTEKALAHQWIIREKNEDVEVNDR